MLKFYFNASPNPTKIALFLEESGLPYQAVPIDTRKGEQFSAEYMAINPNAKVPAIDDNGTIVFDSNAILLYLADKTGQFLGPKADMLSWLMFIASGIGPYTGQAVHFKYFAPDNNAYAIDRYTYEVDRHFGILNERLATRPYLLGTHYSIVDMAAWGWARILPFAYGAEAWEKFPHLGRLVREIDARPAAERAIALKDRFPFKAEMDDEARRFMFRHVKAA
jgi:GST-like protein